MKKKLFFVAQRHTTKALQIESGACSLVAPWWQTKVLLYICSAFVASFVKVAPIFIEPDAPTPDVTIVVNL